MSLLPQLLPSVPAYSLNRACASAAQAITNAAELVAEIAGILHIPEGTVKSRLHYALLAFAS